MKQRIWELDAARGLCIIAMVVIHFIYDAVSFFGLVHWTYAPWFTDLMNWGGIVFLLISGICATLGTRCVHRGLIVLSCGMVITAVTAAMYRLGLADRIIMIYFGVLHCLGLCMVLWHFLKALPSWALALLGVGLTGLGLWMRSFTVEVPYFFWLGLITPAFESSDYFPLLPNLGFFLLGAFIGRTLYRQKQTLFPGIDPRKPLIRFFRACGQHSLMIYMLHQPILALIITLLSKIT